MTEPKYTNTDCPLYATKYCTQLNMQNCEKCTVDCSDDEKTERVKQDLDDMARLLPEGGMSQLFAGEECMLCKGEKHKKEYYAFTDIGHAGSRKNRAKGILGMLKKEPRFGTLLPIQIGCCRECKKHFMLISYIKSIIVCAFTVIPLAVMSFRSVSEPLMAITHGLPFYIFAASVALGVIIGTLVKRSLIKRCSEDTYINIMQAPVLSDMAQNGWFELLAEKGVSKLVFSKKPADHGLFSAMPMAAEEENDAHAAAAVAAEGESNSENDI